MDITLKLSDGIERTIESIAPSTWEESNGWIEFRHSPNCAPYHIVCDNVAQLVVAISNEDRPKMSNQLRQRVERSKARYDII